MRSILSFVVTLLGVVQVFAVYLVHETRLGQKLVAAFWSRFFKRTSIGWKRCSCLFSVRSRLNMPNIFTPKDIFSEETISVTNWLVDSGFSRDRLRLL